MTDAERRERRKLLAWLESSVVQMDTQELRLIACMAAVRAMTLPELDRLVEILQKEKVIAPT